MTSELVERLRNYGDLTDSEVHSSRIEAADEIERLTAQLAEARAEIERAKLEGVRAGIEAARETLKTVPTDKAALWDVNAAIRALDAAAIARAAALSDLIAGDAHLIDTVGDSDGDDGA